MNATLKKLIAELIGTFIFLLAISGATASGSTLKQISLSLALGLMILTLGGISGGHFNPAVSIYFFAKKNLQFGEMVAYIIAQLVGAYFGVVTGLGIWGQPVKELTDGNAVTPPVFIGEVIATAGLVFIIGTLIKNKQANLIWISVAAWVFAAGTFTVTGAMANPAVAFGLMFTGISTGSIASIVVAQLLGLVVAILLLMITGAEIAKKVAAKKPVAKKAVAKKAVAKKAPVKKPVAKK